MIGMIDNSDMRPPCERGGLLTMLKLKDNIRNKDGGES